MTKQEPRRVAGNKKGVFTRERQEDRDDLGGDDIDVAGDVNQHNMKISFCKKLPAR